MYYTNTDRCKRVILRHITEAGGGGRGRSVSTITAIGQTVVIATVVKKVQMRRQKRCTCKKTQNIIMTGYNNYDEVTRKCSFVLCFSNSPYISLLLVAACNYC